MRILIISTLYYPARSPNVYRWEAIARYWTSQGHEVHWLCTRLGGEPRQAKVNELFIHRAGHHTLLDWLYDVLGKKNKRRGTLGAGTPNQSQWRMFIEQIVNLTWRKIYWPDGSCIWYFPARKRALQLMRQHHFDVAISVSLPFSSVLIAAAVKKKYPTVRWLMDIEDPFSFVEEYFINNRYLYKNLNVKAESGALHLADEVSVTVDAARRKYIDQFPFVEGKISVIPPLWEEVKPAKNPQSQYQSTDEHIHLGYFGTFYFPIRGPEVFLRLLSLIKKEQPELANRLTVHLVGAIPVEYAGLITQFSELKGILRFYGLVSREQTARMMEDMDFLVNIGNTTDYHLPSKSAEYLAAGKPIINVCQHSKDTFDNFFEGHPLFLSLQCSDSRTLFIQVIKFCEFVSHYAKQTVEKQWLIERKRRFAVEAIANQYSELLGLNSQV